jgi:hypothetical protein
VCHLYQVEALVRALRDAGNSEVHYFITTAGHSSLEPETDSRLRAIMDDLASAGAAARLMPIELVAIDAAR